MWIMQNPILEYSALRDAGKYSLGYRNMKGKVSQNNLAILDPMAKMIYRFGMRFGRYGRTAPTVKI